MPCRSLALACTTAALLLAGAAAAQSNSDPDAQWGAHAGVVTGPDVAGARASAGLHWRPRFTGALGLELSAGYERFTFVSGARRVDVDHIPVEGSLLFFFLTSHRVQPYLLAGIGYHWVNPYGAGFSDGTPYASQNLFAVHGGAGVDVRAGERLSFWLDGRWTALAIDAVTDLGLKSDTITVSAGVNLFF
jgi:opacity protein-like surface antigen